MVVIDYTWNRIHNNNHSNIVTITNKEIHTKQKSRAEQTQMWNCVLDTHHVRVGCTNVSSSTCFFFHSHRFCFLVVDILIRWRTHSINNSDSLIHNDKPYGGIMKSVETRQMGHERTGDILHASHSHTHTQFVVVCHWEERYAFRVHSTQRTNVIQAIHRLPQFSFRRARYTSSFPPPPPPPPPSAPSRSLGKTPELTCVKNDSHICIHQNSDPMSWT